MSRSTQELGKPPEIISAHVAGDKIPYNRFYYIGDTQELFEELINEGFSFVD